MNVNAICNLSDQTVSYYEGDHLVVVIKFQGNYKIESNFWEKDEMKNKCVLAYSGGLDTSAIIPWIRDNYNFDVIAYCCNVGNLPPEQELREQALCLGAVEFVYEDAQAEFVRDYVYPMLRAGATYYDDYLLGTAIARPLIAAKLASFAKLKKASVIAHGATGKGNDHIRFERAWAFLCPTTEVIAPWKIWNYRSREELVSFLDAKGYKWGHGKKNYSVDLNSFHRSCEGGNLENIEQPYPSTDVQEWISTLPNMNSSSISLQIEKGFVVGVNGRLLSPMEVLSSLNRVASSYGIGLSDIVEERINGIKSRGIYETPGGTIIHIALKALKQVCWSRELYMLSQVLSDKFGQLIYEGQWFSDSRLAIENYFAQASTKLSGQIDLLLSNNTVRIMARKSLDSLYNPSIVSFESDAMDIHKASLGYTKIMTLASLTQGQRGII